jgi:hypothetical protein
LNVTVSTVPVPTVPLLGDSLVAVETSGAVAAAAAAPEDANSPASARTVASPKRHAADRAFILDPVVLVLIATREHDRTEEARYGGERASATGVFFRILGRFLITSPNRG